LVDIRRRWHGRSFNFKPYFRAELNADFATPFNVNRNTTIFKTMSTRLKDRVAIITGGAQGIGRAAVETFVREGAAVSIWDMGAEKGEALAKELAAQGHKAEFRKVNVAKYEEVEAAAKGVVEKWGKIDILVNNAGITRDKTLLKMDSAMWQAVIDVNLTGVFNCTRVVAPYMVEKSYGRIINTSSVVGVYGNRGQVNYSATKAGVIAMAKTLAKELGPKGITVNAVAPGYTGTEMVMTVPAEILEGMKNDTPLRRLGTVQDIANAYLFLASEEASFVTGTVLNVDGGLTL
jgi:3-oxoacyl-[acyl-carrier protein] reductase